jgi:hypothetical protein
MISLKRVLTMAAVSLLLVAPTAFADSFSFSVSSSTLVNLSSPNDNYWGDYETHVDGPGTTPEVRVNAPFVNGEISLTNVSFFLPAGSTITSASMELILPTTVVDGTSVAGTVGHFPPPNPSDPTQIAPTFVDPGTAYLNPISSVNGTSNAGAGIFDITDQAPVITGSQISTGDVSLDFTGDNGWMEAIVATQGYNFGAYVDASGEVNLPFTIEVVGDYTVTPEPSGMVLLGTGVLALLAVAWWQRAAGC